MSRASPGLAIFTSLLLAFGGGGASALEAQFVSSLDAGVASVRFRATPRATALVLSPAVRLERRRSVLVATGTLAFFEGGDLSGQGALAASVFTPSIGQVFGELSMIAEGGSYRGTRAGQALAHARLRLQGTLLGAWLGGGVGRARHTDSWHTVTVADAGVSATMGAATMTVSLTSTGFPLIGRGLDPIPSAVPSSDRVTTLASAGRRDHFLDAATSLSWPVGPTVDLDFALGTRGATRVSNDEAWGRAGATVWLSQRLALIAGVGRFAYDPSQNLQASEYATIAVRMGARSTRTRAASSGTSSLSSGLILHESRNGSRTIRIRVPGARRVELMGDFTDWKVVTLRRVNDDVWAVALPIDAGTYRFSIRADSGAWRAPPGLPAFTDDFNGEVGVLVVK